MGERRELRRQLEAVAVGEVDVDEGELGLERTRRFERRDAVARLADDPAALALQQPARARTKPGVIVDDQHACSHPRSLSLADGAGDVRLAVPRPASVAQA